MINKNLKLQTGTKVKSKNSKYNAHMINSNHEIQHLIN